jgi:hypothetical protein
MRECRSKPKKE